MRKLFSILTVCLALGAMFTQAQTLDKDGLRYNVLGQQGVSVCVNPDDTTFLRGRVEIPSQVEIEGTKYNVVALTDTAFKNCDLIKTLVIPSTVKNIGKNIVDYCFALTDFEVQPGGNYKAEEGILFTADGKELVSCPSGKGGEYVVPASVQKIHASAFASCKNLSKITLPEGLTEVEDYTFYECWGLADIVFPKSLESIGKYAFDGTILQFLNFDKNLKRIGDHAFDRSSMVEVMLLGNEPPALGEMVFGGDMGYTRLYVPVGTRNKYKKSEWKLFPVIYEGNKSRRWKGSYR